MSEPTSSRSGLPRPYDGQLDDHVRLAGASESLVGEPALRPGDRFGDYEIKGSLGVGGMGRVYRAWHRPSNAIVALKLARRRGGQAADLRARLQNEAEVLRQLRARPEPLAGVVRLIDAGEADGAFYVATELLDGVDLLAWVRERPRSARQLLAVAGSVARTLAALHPSIRHRDLTPSNVIVDAQRGPVLIDFGLGGARDLPHPHLTRTGAVPGKAAYLPPEAFAAPDRAAAASDEVRRDLYAFGGCLQAMLTEEECDPRLRYELYPALGAVDDPCTRKLKLIARKCLARRCEHRFADAAELVDALHRAQHPPPAWRQRSLVAIAVLFIGLLFGLAQIAGGAPRPGDAPNLFWSHLAHLGMLTMFLSRALWVRRHDRPRLELPRFMPWVWGAFLAYYAFNATRDGLGWGARWVGVVDATLSNFTGVTLLLAACSLWLPTRADRAGPSCRRAQVAIVVAWGALLALAWGGAAGAPAASFTGRATLMVSLPSSLFVGFGLGTMALGLGQKSLQAPLLGVAVLLIYALLQVVYPAFAWIHERNVGLLIAIYALGMIGKLALFLSVEATVRSWSLFGYEGQLSGEW
ncbi:MAG: serine/threonine-protein kinase [Planctomycetota bacterium]